jgi:hypothetical protein
MHGKEGKFVRVSGACRIMETKPVSYMGIGEHINKLV